MTEAELEEGRRLLEAAEEDGAHPNDIDKATEWLWEHRKDLLARPEEIARESVREFAEAVCNSQPCAPGFQGTVKAIAAARGVNLDEKR